MGMGLGLSSGLFGSFGKGDMSGGGAYNFDVPESSASSGSRGGSRSSRERRSHRDRVSLVTAASKSKGLSASQRASEMLKLYKGGGRASKTTSLSRQSSRGSVDRDSRRISKRTQRVGDDESSPLLKSTTSPTGSSPSSSNSARKRRSGRTTRSPSSNEGTSLASREKKDMSYSAIPGGLGTQRSEVFGNVQSFADLMAEEEIEEEVKSKTDQRSDMEQTPIVRDDKHERSESPTGLTKRSEVLGNVVFGGIDALLEMQSDHPGATDGQEDKDNETNPSDGVQQQYKEMVRANVELSSPAHFSVDVSTTSVIAEEVAASSPTSPTAKHRGEVSPRNTYLTASIIIHYLFFFSILLSSHCPASLLSRLSCLSSSLPLLHDFIVSGVLNFFRRL